MEDILQKTQKNIMKIDTVSFKLLEEIISNNNKKLLVDLIDNDGIDIFVTDINRNTPLHICAKFHSYSISKIFLKKGMSINGKNSDGDTPLHYAIIMCKANKQKTLESFVKFLIKKGSNVNVRCKEGFSCLHYATKLNYIDIAKFLIKNRADVNIKDETGRRPLHFATSIDMIDLLLDNNAKINIKDDYGETPLCSLCKGKMFPNIVLVSHLLKKGADKNISDQNSYTPEMYANAIFV